jgi:DNA end-binding protein Ku
MPRASWRGFLRLSLVSCPIYLSPATTRTKPIRLHQVWQPAPADVGEDDLPDRSGGQQDSAPSVTRLRADNASADGDESSAALRITLRPHDPGTGEEIDKREVLKGYEYSRGQFVTFTADELKALDVESTKIVDLEKFVPGRNIDPVYFDSPYYLYPDGPIAVEALRVIGAAMAEVGVVGIGRLTLSRRERMVMVEPRGAGWRYSHCTPQRRFGRRNSASPRVRPMPRWSPSPRRSSRSGPGVLIRAPTETATRRPCES